MSGSPSSGPRDGEGEEDDWEGAGGGDAGGSVTVAVGLGSNRGDRAAHLAGGVRGLGRYLGAGVRCSSVYETEPVGASYAGQRRFLNLCCVGDTGLPPRALLEGLLSLEAEAGRTRPARGGAPRCLDADLLLYGERVIDEPGLRVPHPRMAERAFVLVPLAEIAPEMRHPVLDVPVGELAARVDARGVRKYRGELPDPLSGRGTGNP